MNSTNTLGLPQQNPTALSKTPRPWHPFFCLDTRAVKSSTRPCWLRCLASWVRRKRFPIDWERSRLPGVNSRTRPGPVFDTKTKSPSNRVHVNVVNSSPDRAVIIKVSIITGSGLPEVELTLQFVQKSGVRPSKMVSGPFRNRRFHRL